MSRPRISGIVLAGGRSVRMGSDKRRVVVHGASLLDRALRTIDGLVDDVVVVTHDEEGAVGRARVMRDDIPERGPLGGLLTGLRRVRHLRALVVPVDMPLLTPQLLAYLIGVPNEGDITVPRWQGGVEPLVSVYGMRCSRSLEGFLQRPSASARDFIRAADLPVRYVEEAELRRFGEPAVLFFNVNTPEEAQEAEQLLRAREEQTPMGATPWAG